MALQTIGASFVDEQNPHVLEPHFQLHIFTLLEQYSSHISSIIPQDCPPRALNVGSVSPLVTEAATSWCPCCCSDISCVQTASSGTGADVNGWPASSCTLCGAPGLRRTGKSCSNTKPYEVLFLRIAVVSPQAQHVVWDCAPSKD
jgi:hypothetical protein